MYLNFVDFLDAFNAQFSQYLNKSNLVNYLYFKKINFIIKVKINIFQVIVIGITLNPRFLVHGLKLMAMFDTNFV